MATIGQRQFQDGAHKYLSLANEEWTRTLRIGNNWRSIRLLFRIAVTPDGTSNLAGCRLVSGMCFTTLSGRTYNAVNTMNFVGQLHWHTNQVSGQALTYTANSGNPYYTQSTTNGSFLQKYNGASSVVGCNDGLNIVHTNTGAIQRRTALGQDIWKPNAPGGHATSLRNRILSCTGAATYSVDFDDFYFRDSLAIQQRISGNGTTGGTQDLAPAVAGGEGNYPLDSATIFWNLSSFPMEIYDAVAIRFY